MKSINISSVVFSKLSFIGLLIIVLISNCDYQPYSQGAELYNHFCANCHMEDGKGLKMIIPPLANADYLKNKQVEIPCLIKNGIKGPIIVNGKTYQTEMAGIPSLNDIQINNIINYINNAWGNNYGDSNVKKVNEYLENCN